MKPHTNFTPLLKCLFDFSRQNSFHSPERSARKMKFIVRDYPKLCVGLRSDNEWAALKLLLTVPYVMCNWENVVWWSESSELMSWSGFLDGEQSNDRKTSVKLFIFSLSSKKLSHLFPFRHLPQKFWFNFFTFYFCWNNFSFICS